MFAKSLYYVYYVNSFLSILCCVALVTSWRLLPRWRTLQNYIVVNQIITGTLEVLCDSTLTYLTHPYYQRFRRLKISIQLSEDFDSLPLSKQALMVFKYCLNILQTYLSILTMCWSVCASLDAYIKLVLLSNKKLSYEKRIYTVFAYLAAALIYGVNKFIDHNLPTGKYHCYPFAYYFPLLIVWSISLAMYVSIVLSILPCGKRKVSSRNIRHVLSLIGVAVMCDSLKILIVIKQLVVDVATFYYNAVIFTLNQLTWLDIGSAMFTSRWILQTFFVLLKKTSRMHWKAHLRKRRSRNNIELG